MREMFSDVPFMYGIVAVVNSPSQNYTHPDDQTTLLDVTPVFKPFTVKNCLYRNDDDILLYYDKTIIDVSLKCQSKHVLDSKECKS